MFIVHTFTMTFAAMFQIFLLGLCGYVLVKKDIISAENIKALSRLIIGLLLPCFIFAKFIENFSFIAFRFWWVFPLMSIVVTVIGFMIGDLVANSDTRLKKFRQEFVGLVAFQNSGYLPLLLVALLLPAQQQERMFILIFLFLLGFNLVLWSAGVFYLTRQKGTRLHIGSLLSPPVVAIIASLFIIVIGVNRFIPPLIIAPVKMLGECTLPLAMLVVGANFSLATKQPRENAWIVFNIVVAKLLLMPLFVFGILLLLRPPHEMAFLLLLESIVPSATSLSLIMRTYEKEDNIISAGVFWTHVISLITIPLFLVLFSLLRFYLTP